MFYRMDSLADRAIRYLQQHGTTEPARLAAHVFGGEAFAYLLPEIAPDRLQFDGFRWNLKPAGKSLAFLQLLTSGPNPARHRIVEVAAVHDGREFHAFVDAGRPVPAGLRRLGVPEFPEGLPMDQARRDIRQFLADSTLVCFDAKPPFLDQLLGPAWPAIDLLRLVFSLTYFAGRPDPARLAQQFDLKPPPNRGPRAMADFAQRLFQRISAGHGVDELLRLGAVRPPEVERTDIPANQPGVYVMASEDGRPLYVGKSKDLKRRVNSYLGQPIAESRGLYHLLEMTDRIELIPVNDEVEALLLESELIQRWLPPFNVQRGRHYGCAFLRLSVGEAFPRLTVARGPEPDGAIYVGPFRHPTAAARMHGLLSELLRLRTCARHLPPRRKPKPACRLAVAGRCLAPCVPGPPAQPYSSEVALARQLLSADLEGFRRELLRLLRQRPPAPERVHLVKRRLRALAPGP
ncbi:MAG: GIY-YIG nuclease family protein [Chloroflexota bacterium]|nr:GIY-YIG nuclease family protein [Chloroflexota bacterium]